jgi:hypothetical protein
METIKRTVVAKGWRKKGEEVNGGPYRIFRRVKLL